MVDKDGRFKYSNILKVNIGSAGNYAVYPNPASTFVTFSYPKLITATEVNLINSNGSVVKTISLAANTSSAQINISNLPAGLYCLKFLKQNQTQTTKFLKQ